jgi:hypothetical protein
MPKASARFAIALPIRPRPTMPSRAPLTLRASGIGPFSHLPSRT